MIEKRKVIALGVSRYVGLPKDFKIEPGKTLVVIHNQVIGFAAPDIADMTNEMFEAELDAVCQMLIDARRILAAEKRR